MADEDYEQVQTSRDQWKRAALAEAKRADDLLDEAIALRKELRRLRHELRGDRP